MNRITKLAAGFLLKRAVKRAGRSALDAWRISKTPDDNVLAPLVSGLAGACTLTLINETARQFMPHAPRLDAMGIRALAKSMRALEVEPPRGDQLRGAALVGDLATNTIFYSVVGLGDPRHAMQRGVLLGLGAGLGAAFLPQRIGLGQQPGAESPTTPLLTVAWYLAGGVAAACVYDQLTQRR